MAIGIIVQLADGNRVETINNLMTYDLINDKFTAVDIDNPCIQRFKSQSRKMEDVLTFSVGCDRPSLTR